MTKTSRKLHLWLSLLFAPSLVFFAITGSLMIFGVGEANGPLAKLSEVHKIQSIDERPARPSRTSAATPAVREQVAMRDTAAPAAISDAAQTAKPAPARAPLHRSLPLMIWFGALAIGLVVSAIVGVYLAFAYKRDRATVYGLLAAGFVIPIVLAFL